MDAPALSNWAGLAGAKKAINGATPGLGTSVCYPPTNRHHAIPLMMPPQPARVSGDLAAEREPPLALTRVLSFEQSTSRAFPSE